MLFNNTNGHDINTEEFKAWLYTLNGVHQMLVEDEETLEFSWVQVNIDPDYIIEHRDEVDFDLLNSLDIDYEQSSDTIYEVVKDIDWDED